MAAFRKASWALLLVIAAMLSADVANAQDPFAARPLGRINCTASSVPTNVRSEGLAELFGDYLLDCQNTGDPALSSNYVQYVNTNIELELINSSITNSVDVGGTGFSDAVLIVNENNAYNPLATSVVDDISVGGCPAGVTLLDSRFPCPQKGTLVANNTRFVWNGLSFPVPFAPNDVASAPLTCAGFADHAGTVAAPVASTQCFPPTTTIRITNVRGNATVFGQGVAEDIRSRLTITGPAQIFVDDNIKTLATPRIGLFSEVEEAVEGLHCIGVDEEDAIIELTEGFASSFKTLGAPSFALGATKIAENGYPVLQSNSAAASPQSNARSGGGADQATRFRIELSNIPEGVTITAPGEVLGSPAGVCAAPTDGGLCLNLVTGTNEDGGGGALRTTPYEVPLSNGAGLIVYQVMDTNPFQNEVVDIALTIDAPFDEDEPDLPGIGSGLARVTFGPLCEDDADCSAATNDFEIPRFIDSGGDPGTLLTIVRCTTTLLWPFVTNKNGFDTGIVVSNTSMDWLGTPPQRGQCTFHYIGEDAPPDMEETSAELEGGDQIAFTLSSGSSAEIGLLGAPGFQGFIVATCDFQYAHGYAFLQDGFTGIPTLAQGYLALVIPLGSDGDRAPGNWHAWGYGDSSSNSGPIIINDGLGERLGH